MTDPLEQLAMFEKQEEFLHAEKSRLLASNEPDRESRLAEIARRGRQLAREFNEFLGRVQ